MDAESLLRRALEIRAEADGKDTTEYATALINLAVSLKAQVHVTLPFLLFSSASHVFIVFSCSK